MQIPRRGRSTYCSHFAGAYLAVTCIFYDACQPTAMPPHRQKAKLIGPARNRQMNSALPTGNASASVKNHISVKKSHRVDPGSPKHPHPNFPRMNLIPDYPHQQRIGPGQAGNGTLFLPTPAATVGRWSGAESPTFPHRWSVRAPRGIAAPPGCPSPTRPRRGSAPLR